jgi:hypothetical protein
LENYGIRITARCPMTSEVLSAVCQFCDSFGAEDNNNPDCKRKRTSNISYFKKPWPSDHMKRYCDTFHTSRFAAFNSLNTQEKKNFFKETGKNTTLKLFSKPTKAESIDCMIGTPNIDVIVAELLLEPMMEEEGNDINYEAKALSIFQLNNADIEHPYYSVHISNAILFQLIVSYFGCGISCCQCVQIVSKTKETLGIGNIGCINVGKVIQYVWYLCAINYNAFNILLTDYVWAFSIAFE